VLVGNLQIIMLIDTLYNWHFFQTLSEDNLTQLDEFYQLIAPSVTEEKT